MQLHFITPEYPPQIGGVSTYTQLVARRIAADGHHVHVWCPGSAGMSDDGGAVVHSDLDDFSIGRLWLAGREMSKTPPSRRLLIQWVPHGFGWRSMNVAFCLWLAWRSIVHRDELELVVHEACLPFKRGKLRQNAAAAVHRLMLFLVLNSCRRVWMTVVSWEPLLRPLTFRRLPFQWLPACSNIPVSPSTESAEIRSRFVPAQDDALVGCFGIHGPPISAMVRSVVERLLRDPRIHVLLIGSGSEEFAESFRHARVHGTGPLPDEDISQHLQACDVMLQPYPDGVSARRSTVMAAMEHGKAIVTTAGPASEPFWKATRAVAMRRFDDIEGLADAARALAFDRAARNQLGQAARALYMQKFELGRLVSELTRRYPAATLSEDCLP